MHIAFVRSGLLVALLFAMAACSTSTPATTSTTTTTYTAAAPSGSFTFVDSAGNPVTTFTTDIALTLRSASDDVPLLTFTASGALDFSQVIALHSSEKTVVHFPSSADKSGITGTVTLYIPASVGQNQVVICPGAITLDDVQTDCTSAVTLTTTAPTSGHYTWTNTDRSGTTPFAVACDIANFSTGGVGHGQYTVTPSAGANGSIAGSTAQVVSVGDDLQFTATPATGFAVAQWTLDGTVVQTGGATYTVTDVAADHTIAVSFSNIQYTIGGSITGLVGSGLVLRNSASGTPDDIAVSANATSFQFAGTAIYGNAYVVTVATQPTRQFCTVTNAADVNFHANITNIGVSCVQVPLAYVSSSSTNELWTCPLDATTGLFGTCSVTPADVQTWTPFQTSFATVNGTPYVYIAENNECHISRCAVNSATGAVSDCVTADTVSYSGWCPTGVTAATIGSTTYVYVGNNVGATLYRCTLHADGTFDTCLNTPSSPPDWDPFALTFATVNDTTYAYIAGGGQNEVYYCAVNPSDGTFSACQLTPSSGAPAWTPDGIAIATVNGTQYAYVPDWSSNIYRCALASDGSFSACSAALASPDYTSPRSIAFATVLDTQYAYVSDIVGDVYRCTLNSDGTFNTCTSTPTTDAPDWAPRSITLIRVPY